MYHRFNVEVATRYGVPCALVLGHIDYLVEKARTDGEKKRNGKYWVSKSVKKIAERQYQIARVTVYGPTVYSFTIAEDGTVSSDELGSGSISYRSDLKLTTIRFEKTNFLCELSR